MRDQYATTILRISCSNNADGCPVFKVIAICDRCVLLVEKRINNKSPLSCAKCGFTAPASEFWDLLGRSQ